MANELAIGLVIGAALKGSFIAAFGKARKTIDELGNGLGKAMQTQEKLSAKIAKSQEKQIALQQKISKAYLTGDENVAKLVRRYEKVQASISKAVEKQQLFTKAIKRSEAAQQTLSKAVERQEQRKAHRDELKGKIFNSTAATAAVAIPVWSSVKTFIEQEESANNLKIAMMKADGTIGQFNEISKIAGDLGRDLPGTRKDFYNLAQALKTQGFSDKVLLGGALKTSAELNVLLDMDQFAGGEFLAKLMEGHGLKESELGAAADSMQRAMFASGLNKDQMYESMKYYAPAANQLGLTGQKNAEKIFAVEGMAAKVGIEGSTFGTSFNELIGRMATGPEKLKEATKGLPLKAKKMLKGAGVELNFWDKKGNFKGIDAMMVELQKLDKVREKYGEKGLNIITKQLFEEQGGRLAAVLAQKGKAGYDEMLQSMREQASLQDRINQKTATLSAALEQLGGVWESAVGTFGSTFADDIKQFAGIAQDFIENSLTPWLEKNKQLVKWAIGLAAGMATLSTGIYIAKFAFSGLATVASGMLMPIRLFKATKALAELDKLNGKATVFDKMVKGLGKTQLATAFAAGGYKSFAKTVITAGRAMLFSPVGAAIGIIAVGFAIYKCWKPLKAFFGGFFSAIGKALKPLEPMVNALGSAFSKIWDYVSPIISPIIGFFSDLFSAEQLAEGGARSLGEKVGGFVGNAIMGIMGVVSFFQNMWTEITTAFDGGLLGIGRLILNWLPINLFRQAFAAVLSWFGIDIPNNFSTFASQALQSFTNWVVNWDILGAFKGVFDQVFEWFSNLPSRFAQYGSDIVDGIKNGVSGFAGRAKDSVVSLADSVGGWFKKKLDINSPSRVFKGYGVNVVEGLVIGMDNKQSMAAQSTQALGDTLQSSMLKTLEPPALATPSFVPPKQGFLSNLWDDLKFGANFIATSLGFTSPDLRTPSFNPDFQISPNPSLPKRGTEGGGLFANYEPLNRNAVTHNATTNNQGGIVVHFNPTINVNGNAGQGVVEQVQQALQMGSYEFEQMLNRVLDQRQRRAY